jgi:hypothetical protein
VKDLVERWRVEKSSFKKPGTYVATGARLVGIATLEEQYSPIPNPKVLAADFFGLPLLSQRFAQHTETCKVVQPEIRKVAHKEIRQARCCRAEQS